MLGRGVQQDRARGSTAAKRHEQRYGAPQARRSNHLPSARHRPQAICRQSVREDELVGVDARERGG